MNKLQSCQINLFFIENKQMFAQFNERPIDGWLGMFQCREVLKLLSSLTL